MKLLRTPTPALLLGFSGLIPFWGLVIVVLYDHSYKNYIAEVQVYYGAVILSFLGGIHWGVELMSKQKMDWMRLTWGVLPSLIGWIALMFPLLWSLSIIILGLTASAWADVRFFKEPITDWYRQFRIALTVIAVSALLIMVVLLS